MVKEDQKEPVGHSKRTRDIEINILVRSSEEDVKSLNSLCDQVITCVLSEYEVVLVEKETKVLLSHQKSLKSIRLILQEPPEPVSSLPPSLR